MNITLTCKFCGREFEDEITEQEYENYMTGNYHLIQDCFPKMRPEYREMLISGMCPICWKEQFSFEEDEEDEGDDIYICEVDSLGDNWW